MSQSLDIPANRILVIDDNPSIHEDFRKILDHEDPGRNDLDEAEAALFGEVREISTMDRFEMDSAFQGQEGLAMVRKAVEEERPYSMAFIDVRMPPGWDGIETVKNIWKDYPELQVVICTAYSDYSWEQIREQLGTGDNVVILKKPFDNVEVLQLAHALTKKWILASQTKLKLDELDLTVTQRSHELVQANQKLQEEASERSKAEEALRASEVRFKKAFQASPIPIAIQNLSTFRFLDVNESFVKLSHYQPQDIVGKTSEELSLFSGVDAGQSSITSFLNRKEILRNFQCQLQTQTGEKRRVLVSTEYFQEEGTDYLLLLLQDVSELNFLEEQLNQAKKMEAVGQLAAGVAHDFNNILTIIQGHVHLRMQTQTLESKVQQSLKEVSDAAERAAGLTRQLLAFSRKQIIHPQPVDLTLLVDNMGKLLHRLIGEHIELKVDQGENLPLIHADSCNMEQIIINLCVNARDAMPDGGSLTLKTRSIHIDESYWLSNSEAIPGDYVCLSVIDTGMGMEEPTKIRIFEPFFTTKEIGKGTGMGLATVHGIVKQHNGWLELDSNFGVGSTFRVFLPITKEARIEEPSNLAPAIHSVAGKTILYAEDEENLRNVIQEVLTSFGFRVLSAENGFDALKLWHSHRNEVDLLLTDIVMPGGMSGRELANQIHEDQADLKVIYTSGYSEELFGEGEPLLECENYLPKPYTPTTLTSLLAQRLTSAPSRG